MQLLGEWNVPMTLHGLRHLAELPRLANVDDSESLLDGVLVCLQLVLVFLVLSSGLVGRVFLRAPGSSRRSTSTTPSVPPPSRSRDGAAQVRRSRSWPACFKAAETSLNSAPPTHVSTPESRRQQTRSETHVHPSSAVILLLTCLLGAACSPAAGAAAPTPTRSPRCCATTTKARRVHSAAPRPPGDTGPPSTAAAAAAARR
jgi:hypothetical protein